MPQQPRQVQFIRHTQLPQVELRFSSYREEAFAKHTHDSYSIGVVKDGSTRFYIDGHTEIIHDGEIALINPEVVHACNPVEGSALTYYMLYLGADFVKTIAFDVAGVQDGMPQFTKPIVHDELLFQQLDDFCKALISADDLLEMESRLVAVTADVLVRYCAIEKMKEETAVSLQNSHAYLLNNLANNISLQELAARANISLYHFLRTFQKQYGLPPHTYQLQQRINLAKQQLAAGQPIAQVAVDVGFADQSHFTRKFKSLVGATPRQYQLTQQPNAAR